MPFEFKRSKNRQEREEYYRAYKQFICCGGKVPPLIPLSLTKKQVQVIHMKVARLYTQ